MAFGGTTRRTRQRVSRHPMRPNMNRRSAEQPIRLALHTTASRVEHVKSILMPVPNLLRKVPAVPAGFSKRPSSKAAVSEGPRRTLGVR